MSLGPHRSFFLPLDKCRCFRGTQLPQRSAPPSLAALEEGPISRASCLLVAPEVGRGSRARAVPRQGPPSPRTAHTWLYVAAPGSGVPWVQPLGWGPVGTEACPVRTPRPSAPHRAGVLLLPQPQAAGAQACGWRGCSGPGLWLLVRLTRASWPDLQEQLVGLGARLSSKPGAQVGAQQA